MNEKQSTLDKLDEIIPHIKALAIEYYKITGKPLGVTGEIGEYEAAKILNLKLQEARTAGYDAIRHVDGREEKIQIKSRRIGTDSKPSQRIGSISLDHEWDKVILMILDESLNAIEINEADRSAIEKALKEPGSKARNERGALVLGKFKQIGRRIWSKVAEK